ncbi:MAG TPA: EamA family transporter [Kiloniellaceae bacterium]|nr:EamA family transporter [Kiloniellaceae bacterium]
MAPLHFLMALAVPVIWGMGIVFAKAALDHFPPILLIAFRFAVTAGVLVWFVRPPWPLMGRIFLIALVSVTIQYSLTFTGLKYLDASVTVLVVQLEVPILILIGALFLSERPSPRTYAGIVMTFLGVVLIAGDPNLQGAYFPFFLLLTGVTTWAVGQAMVRKLGGGVGGFTLIAWVAVLGTPQLFFASWLLEVDQLRLIRDADWVVWGTVIYLGLAMTALGYGLWYRLLGRYPVHKVAPFLLLLPVTSVLGSVFVLGETLSLPVMIGGAVVIAGVAFIVLEKGADS